MVESGFFIEERVQVAGLSNKDHIYPELYVVDEPLTPRCNSAFGINRYIFCDRTRCVPIQDI